LFTIQDNKAGKKSIIFLKKFNGVAEKGRSVS
jgi:hypothetical protein